MALHLFVSERFIIEYPHINTNFTALINKAFEDMKSGDTLIFEKDHTFFIMGGVKGVKLRDIVIQIDGKLRFSDDIDNWVIGRRDSPEKPVELMYFEECTNLTFTSTSHRGVLDGNGRRWWGFPGNSHVQTKILLY